MQLVSVIIVNFNAGPLLTDCVRSVLASSVPVEVIVSDNHSEDDSLTRLQKELSLDERLTIIANADNYGFAKANNIALGEAKGDFLLFLNPDCLIRPDTIAQMMDAMATRRNVGLAGCLIRNPDGSEQAGCRRRVPTPWRTFLRLTRLSILARFHDRFDSYVQTDLPVPEEPVEIEAISGAFMFTTRAALEQVGPMDEGYFMHCEDLDWCMRFRQAQMSILFVPHVEILHVGGVCSATRPVSVEYYKHKGMVRFYRKFFRHQYPTVLMWLVMIAVGIRFMFRAADEFLQARRLRPDPIRFLPPPATLAEPRRKAIVTGATSLIGDFLLPALVEAGFEVHAISRKPPRQFRHDGVYWHRWDIAAGNFSNSFGADCLIHLAPLAVLPPLLNSLGSAGLTRLIAFSSTSRFTKEHSGSPKERDFAKSLTRSEDELIGLCEHAGIAWTIFRPTLVYNLGRDKNITTIARFIRRFGFFPLVGEGSGRRQPVHAADLADACMRALDNPNAFNKSYNLSGDEVLAYREMAERIFQHLGKPIRIVTIPLTSLRFLLKSLSLLPWYQHLTPEMANRINLDMCFDHGDAERHFGFRSRGFFGCATRTQATEGLREPSEAPQPVRATAAVPFEPAGDV